MSTDPFQFIPWADLRSLDSPILHIFTAEYVQEFAEDNCGGRLTVEELQQLCYAFTETWDCDYMHDAISKVRPHLRSGRQK
jgi:hypothetical protein